ncbi:MAG: hypothetical protein ACN2B6_11410 [Rickettsiales bacterium]
MSKNSPNFKLVCLVTLSALPFALLASEGEARKYNQNQYEFACNLSYFGCDGLPSASGSGSGYGSSSGMGSASGSGSGYGSSSGSGSGRGARITKMY